MKKRKKQTGHIWDNPVMVKRLKESVQEIKDGKGIKITLDDIWK